MCFKQRACSIQIFNLPALQVDHEKVKKNEIMKKLKKIPTQRLKKKKKKKERKRNVEVLLQLRKKLLRIVHGWRYSVASEKWADCSTVLISMRAHRKCKNKKIKSRKKDTMQQGRKAKKSEKKYYYSSETNSSGLCIVTISCRCSVASHKRADCGTVSKSANLKKNKKEK